MKNKKEKLQTKERSMYVLETFLSPDEYPPVEQRALLEGAPPFDDFPDGMYILGTRGSYKLIGYSATSQIDSYIHDEKVHEKEVAR